jgi:ribosomal protein S18 acetylase RimI-like enzyme
VSTISFRTATRADAEALSEVGRGTFIEAFGHLYSPEDLEAFLFDAHSVAAWCRLLDDDRNVIVVAESAAGMVGYGVGGRCKLPVRDLEARAGEIKRLYVLADAHGQKLGTRMLDMLIAELERREHDPLYVGVWSQNLGAQRLYIRYGFVKVGEYDFPVGRQMDLEFILRRPPRNA